MNTETGQIYRNPEEVEEAMKEWGGKVVPINARQLAELEHLTIRGRLEKQRREMKIRRK